ncbi:MAG: aromatic-ring-hydroxylating dioxygenase subunit beta, partial [Acidimicrobiales bacterium]
MIEPKTTPPAGVPLERVIELTQLLNHEAQLLDDGRYEDWLALLAADITYSAPIHNDQLGDTASSEDEAPTLTYFRDNLGTLQVRVAKIRTGLAQTENPPSRTVRLIGTVTVGAELEPGHVPVRSAF